MYMSNTDDLRKNFNEQLKEISDKITQAEADIEKLKEYALKLQGGLETLDLLDNPPAAPSVPPATSDASASETPTVTPEVVSQ